MKNIKAALQDWFNKNIEGFSRNGLGPEDIAVSSLPAEYDSTPFNTVINGKTVHTVGEYKAEVSKTTTWDHI